MNRTDELLTTGYQFSMGKYLGDAWDLFKKGAGNYIGFTLVFFIIVVVLVFVPFVNFLVSVFEYVLIAGIFIYSQNQLKGTATFANFFEGFNSFGQIFLYFLVLMVFSLPAIIIFVIYLFPEGFLMDVINGADPEYLAEQILSMLEVRMGSIIFLYAVLIMYLVYLYISYSMALIFIVNHKLRFWDAMELSRKIVAKNFFAFLGMYILLWVMTSVGVIITCGLGALVAFPYINLVIFSAYDNIVGPLDEPEQSLDL